LAAKVDMEMALVAEMLDPLDGRLYVTAEELKKWAAPIKASGISVE
jgi:hypothetical protein